MSEFSFRATTHPWEAQQTSWVFAHLPEDVADAVADIAPDGRGFGSVRVRVTVGKTTWDTSLFPSKDLGTYVLPLKAAVRRAEGITVGDEIRVSVVLL